MVTKSGGSETFGFGVGSRGRPVLGGFFFSSSSSWNGRHGPDGARKLSLGGCMVSQARWTRRAVRGFSGRAWLYGEWRLGGSFYYVWWTVSITNTGMKSTSGRHTSKAWGVATFWGFCYYFQTILNFFW